MRPPIFVTCIVLACSKTPPAPVGQRASAAPVDASAKVAAGASHEPSRGKTKPLVDSMPESYSSGIDPCPPAEPAKGAVYGPLGASCGNRGELDSCQLYERVECRAACYGYRTRTFSCKDGAWAMREAREPPCVCEPKQALPQLAKCTRIQVGVKPSEVSPSDQCALALSCEGRDLRVECDAEADGTGTSLCSCWRAGREVRIAGNPYAGEGPEACFSAAAACAAARR